MSSEHFDSLRSLRNEKVDISLEQSLLRADALETRKSKARRTMLALGLLSAMTIAILVRMYEHTEPPSHDRSYVPSASANARLADAHASVTVAKLATPHRTVAASAITRRFTTSMPSSFMPLPVVIASREVQQRLAIDISAIETILSIIGSGDRVVSADSAGKTETCLSITCAGGDLRNIVCTAPSPSPVRVTKADGELLYDIERVDGRRPSNALIAIRVSSSRGNLLLWYDADSILLQKLTVDAYPSTMLPVQSSWLQPDRTAVVDLSTGNSPWQNVSIHTADGTPIDAARQWVSHQDGTTELRISDVRTATYDVRITRKDGSMERFIYVVR
jgi:hypothetical protein